MTMPPLISITLTAIISFLVLLKLLKPLALNYGLTDKPTSRKAHKGRVPLLGGIVIWLSVVIATLASNIQIPHAWAFYLAGSLTVLLGAIDDKYNLSVRIRFAMQIIISLIMAVGAENTINNLGAILGPDIILLNGFSYLFTVICIVGVMNAINMMDGIDGLAASVCLISFAGILFLRGEITSSHSQLIICIMASLLVFISFNLNLWRIPRGKLFLGDAGSMLLGLLVVWFMGLNTQGTQATFKPIIAVWLIAIPLIDMASIMYRRIRKKQSPFKPDRDHLHHIFMRANLSNKQALLAIVLLTTAVACFGIIGQLLNIQDYLLFLGFFLLLTLYSYLITHSWKLARFIKKHCPQPISKYLEKHRPSP